MNVSYIFHDPASTLAWARMVGARLRGGEIIELAGDIGSGKTTLTHGLAEGAGSLDRTASPTFTVQREYRVPAKPNRSLRTIIHVDLYRLSDIGLMAHELADSIGDPATCVVIEWAEQAGHVLPTERLTVQMIAVGEQDRRLSVQCPDTLNYLLETT